MKYALIGLFGGSALVIIFFIARRIKESGKYNDLVK